MLKLRKILIQTKLGNLGNKDCKHFLPNTKQTLYSFRRVLQVTETCSKVKKVVWCLGNFFMSGMHHQCFSCSKCISFRCNILAKMFRMLTASLPWNILYKAETCSLYHQTKIEKKTVQLSMKNVFLYRVFQVIYTSYNRDT